ncbi:unnamed protein product [Rangifer tarandus platyrhynchus]|uniref:Uncharacterized protein n=1 Tax=Rangifer tarandus platyrhynchus TaxID=3082113 RepID=A0AC59ZYK5_RANTA
MGLCRLAIRPPITERGEPGRAPASKPSLQPPGVFPSCLVHKYAGLTQSSRRSSFYHLRGAASFRAQENRAVVFQNVKTRLNNMDSLPDNAGPRVRPAPRLIYVGDWAPLQPPGPADAPTPTPQSQTGKPEDVWHLPQAAASSGAPWVRPLSGVPPPSLRIGIYTDRQR